jgi:hypothetical protein
MPPRLSPIPFGFPPLGMGVAAVGAACTTAVAMEDMDALARALSGSVALVSFVLAEALCWKRPWVARAADAWAVTCTGVVLCFCMAAVLRGPGIGLSTVFTLACCVALPCAAVRWYVRDRAWKLGLVPQVAAPPAARVAIARPRP